MLPENCGPAAFQEHVTTMDEDLHKLAGDSFEMLQMYGCSLVVPLLAQLCAT